jgi:photosystem II stability/assembly factor-like uncharacterized protein
MIVKSFKTLPLLFVFIASSYSQGNWELLIPLPTSNQMNSLTFFDDQTGWSVGKYGTILKTTDGGQNWGIKEIPWLFDLADVQFPSAQTGYVVGTDGFILKTTDGGESWNKQEINYVNNLNRVLFRDEYSGWIIGENGLILYTSDGGANWEPQLSNSRTNLLGICFMRSSGICVVGTDNTILITNDDGQNWETVLYDTTTVCDFYDVYFLNEQYGWIGGTSEFFSGILLKTSNSGESWEKQSINSAKYEDQNYGISYGDPPIKQIYFYDDMMTGIILVKSTGLSGNILLQTTDGGKNWYSYLYGSGESSMTDGRFCVLPGNRVVSTGYRGDFRYSNDRGHTWHFYQENKRWWYNFIIGEGGKLSLSKYHLEEPGIHGLKVNEYFYSEDFGDNWQLFTPQVFDTNGQSLPTPYFKSRTKIDDEDTLWRVGRMGLNNAWIFTSKDLGLTYHEYQRELNIKDFIPDVDLILLTPDTLIYYSIEAVEIEPQQLKSVLNFSFSLDRGRTFTTVKNQYIWNDITPPVAWSVNTTINDHYFLNGHTGFLVGRDGNILKTTDTGQTWENIYSGVVETLWDIEFLNEQTGFVVGDFGRILKSSDGGSTWHKTNSRTQENVYCIGFINDQEGWVGTETGLRYTTDEGETWQGVPLPYQHGIIRNISFDSYGNGYAYTLPSVLTSQGIDDFYANESGTYVYLLRLKNGNVGIDYDSPHIKPEIMSLSPNYPNPFNSTTRIDYYLPKPGIVSLKIFNIQGQLVRTLVNKSIASGHYSTIWDGQSNTGSLVSSGMYIYQLQCNGQVKNHKLLLLK